MKNLSISITAGTAVSWLLFGLIALGMWGCPQYNVWQQDLEGQAELARAKQNRQILIEEAMANQVADSINAEAEVLRAKGLARAIREEKGELNDMYLRYLWIKNLEELEDAGAQIIYVPTEANLPIMEAGRFAGDDDEN